MKQKPFAAILGCGPTGLLAAHACALRQVPFVIISRKQKSVLGGAQFSHISIPMLHDEFDVAPMLTYKVDGDPQTYQEKVYGRDLNVPFVSFEHVKDGQTVPAWPLVQMYDALWERYEGGIVDVTLDAMRVASMANGPFDVVFSSVHAPKICFATVDQSIPHWFRQQTIRLVNYALDPSLPDMTIWYEGTRDHSWYRMSRIFDVGSTEWGVSAPIPPIEGVKTISKPVGTNCNCHQDHVIRVGRFGTWSKGELTFHAFNRVVDTLAQMGVEP